MITKYMIRILILMMMLAGSHKCLAYRPAPKPFYRCQQFIDTELIPALRKSSSSYKLFPPDEYRYDPETGIIPWEVFVEQALIQNAQYRPYWQQQCHYAFAPWAYRLPKERFPEYEDIYCTRHGFYAQVYPQRPGNEVNAKVIRDYFAERCHRYNIDVKDYGQIMAGFAPDPENLSHFGPVTGGFIAFYNSYGFLPIAVAHLAAALLIAFGAQRIYGFRFDRLSWISALGALWIGLQLVYLLLFLQLMLEGWGARYIRFPMGVLGIMNLGNLLLFFFFVAALIVLKKRGKPVAPIVALVFAVIPTIFIVNIISSIIALWSFKKLCHHARLSISSSLTPSSGADATPAF